MKNKKRLLLIILLVLVIGIGGGVGVNYYINESKKADKTKTESLYKDISAQIFKDAMDPLSEEIDFDELHEINEDIIGYIKIPNTIIDYPILQSMTEPDDYYLNRTVELKVGYPGSIYVEKYNNPTFEDNVTVIYGHNMLNGTMFTELHKYEDETFFDENPYIYIYKPGHVMKFQIFSAAIFDDRYLMTSYNYFLTSTDAKQFVSDVKASFDGFTNPDVDTSAPIITLSTCTDTREDQRYLVSAALIDDMDFTNE